MAKRILFGIFFICLTIFSVGLVLNGNKPVSEGSKFNTSLVKTLVKQYDIALNQFESRKNLILSEMLSESKISPDKIYIIKEGDTLIDISRNSGYSVDALAEHNKIRDVNLIYTNSALRFPIDE